jgi:hypothetical protein
VSHFWGSDVSISPTLGLTTDGILALYGGVGGGIVPDPSYAVPAPPFGSAGTLGDGVTLGRKGYWLLQFDTGHTPYMFSTETLRVPSRDGTTLVFAPGLVDFGWTFDSDQIGVTVLSAEDWFGLRKTFGPLKGRAFTLRRWYEGQNIEDAYLALQGVVSDANFGNPSDPDALVLSLDRSELDLSREMVETSGVISAQTWTLYDRQVEGAYYPIVIGYPGREAFPSVPCLNTQGSNKIMVAGHRVHASQVKIFDNTTGATPQFFTCLFEPDTLGRIVTLVQLNAVGPGITNEAGHAYYASYGPLNGGGYVFRGKPVTALGDFLIMGASLWSRAVHDFAAMTAQAQELNQYSIDTVINQPGVKWESYVQENLIEAFQIEKVYGPLGIFYRKVRYAPNTDGVVADLTVSDDHGGLRVARLSALTETSEDIVNEVTVAYGNSAGGVAAYVTLSGVYGGSDPVFTDAAVYPDRVCKLSQALYGVRSQTYTLPTTTERATALRVARDKVARYAFPKLRATYRGGIDLLRLQRQDTVAVYDSTHGADFEGTLAVVESLTLTTANTVDVSLLFDSGV